MHCMTRFVREHQRFIDMNDLTLREQLRYFTVRYCTVLYCTVPTVQFRSEECSHEIEEQGTVQYQSA